VDNVALSGGTIGIVVPAAANTNTYNAELSVRNSTTGCVSSIYNISVVINALPNTGEIITDN